MRSVGTLLLVVWPIALVGCFTGRGGVTTNSASPLLQPSADENSAHVQYVLIERTAGGEAINRRAWDRVDEQILPFETRQILEAAGLRVGTVNETVPGVLRQLIENPRTSSGHRGRLLAIDRPAPLPLTPTLPAATFTAPIGDGKTASFARSEVVLGFELTVRPGDDGKTIVSLVPRARYRDWNELLPADAAERGQATQTFPAAGFEVALLPAEYLVVGTDDFWPGRFGHAVFTGTLDDRRVQSLLVLRASALKPAQKPSRQLRDEPALGAVAPLAEQAAASSGARP